MKSEGGCKYGDDACITDYKVDCSKSGVVYKITCNSCDQPLSDNNIRTSTSTDPGGQTKHNYVGMTTTSIHNRMCRHLAGQRYKHRSNPLNRHDADHHEGVPQKYTSRILAREQKILPLKITEGLYIEAQVEGTSMNDKNEFGRGSLVRIQATRA